MFHLEHYLGTWNITQGGLDKFSKLVTLQAFASLDEATFAQQRNNPIDIFGLLGMHSAYHA